MPTFKEYSLQKSGSFGKEDLPVFSSPKQAYEYALKEQRRIPEVENILLKSPIYAYLYTKDVARGAVPKLEGIISTSADSSFYYAYNVLRGAFPEGEPAMKRSPSIWERYQAFLESLKKS